MNKKPNRQKQNVSSGDMNKIGMHSDSLDDSQCRVLSG
jgi:hypothetical protein